MLVLKKPARAKLLQTTRFTRGFKKGFTKTAPWVILNFTVGYCPMVYFVATFLPSPRRSFAVRA